MHVSGSLIDSGTDALTKACIDSNPSVSNIVLSSSLFGPTCLSVNVSNGLKWAFFAAASDAGVVDNDLHNLVDFDEVKAVFLGTTRARWDLRRRPAQKWDTVAIGRTFVDVSDEGEGRST